MRPKKNKHHNIYPVPSSIDKDHFAKARVIKTDPPDQENIPHPRLGFYGVIDERFNLELLEDMALAKPEWSFILIGPLAKIDHKVMPANPNIYYLGPKNYKLLPAYLSGWDIAIMPFALNESTKYISPTKTPEFLAGGKPVISTSIRDVVIPYGEQGLVHIADSSDAFIETAKKIFSEPDNPEWLSRVDNFLENISWDETWEFMRSRIEESIENKNVNNLKNKQVYV
jgi:UDP-galactopyranose mutase